MTFILSLQQLLNPLGGGLTCDGIAGRQTHNTITCAAALVRPGVYGCARELIGGRASTFGGPDDINDRYLHQAYMPDPGRRTPAEYYAWDLVQPWLPYLRPEMADHTSWPITTREGGKPARAGVSFFLDPSAFYCAYRFTGYLHMALKSLDKNMYTAAPQKRAWLRIYNPAIRDGDGLRMVRCLVTDFGPSLDVWAQVDLSPGAYAALGLSPGADRVRWEIEVEVL